MPAARATPKRRPTPGSPVTPALGDPTSSGGLHLLCLAASAPASPAAPSAHPRPYAFAHPLPHAVPAALPHAVTGLPGGMPPAGARFAFAPYMQPGGLLPAYTYAVYPPPASAPARPAGRRVKGPWRAEEDALLTSLVGRFGARRWTAIAGHIPGRTGKQARERWLNQLSPGLAKRAWSAAEDRIVMDAHARLGNRWSEIAKLLEGRTDNAVKNRFNTTIRRQISEVSRAQRARAPAGVKKRRAGTPEAGGKKVAVAAQG